MNVRLLGRPLCRALAGPSRPSVLSLSRRNAVWDGNKRRFAHDDAKPPADHTSSPRPTSSTALEPTPERQPAESMAPDRAHENLTEHQQNMQHGAEEVFDEQELARGTRVLAIVEAISEASEESLVQFTMALDGAQGNKNGVAKARREALARFQTFLATDGDGNSVLEPELTSTFLAAFEENLDELIRAQPERDAELRSEALLMSVQQHTIAALRPYVDALTEADGDVAAEAEAKRATVARITAEVRKQLPRAEPELLRDYLAAAEADLDAIAQDPAQRDAILQADLVSEETPAISEDVQSVGQDEDDMTGRDEERAERDEEEMMDEDDADSAAKAAQDALLGPDLHPPTASFYTSRSVYYDQIDQFDRAVKLVRRGLTDLNLYPLPKFALVSLPELEHAWIPKEEMALVFNCKLNLTRYRFVCRMLNELSRYRSIAEVAGFTDYADKISDLLQPFEKASKSSILARNKRAQVTLDQYGRSYTLGKRKTSAARVWMIPVKDGQQTPLDSAVAALDIDDGARTEAPSTSSVEDILSGGESSEETAASGSPLADPLIATEKVANLDSIGSSSTTSHSSPVTIASNVGLRLYQASPIQAASILVNNTPISAYFPQASDRERIIRPLKLAGVLGAYNIFALVRGGGISGQSAALAHGIALGISAHVPEVKQMLRTSNIARRDPRQVERKKTGMAKARKRYAWVKR